MEQLEARCLLDAGPLYISEFMAKNKTKYENNAGNDTDWLEVYNPTPSPVTLGSATAGQSYFLTNDATDLTMWAFPAGVSLAAGAYMVVNCDTTPSGGTGAYTNVATVGPWAAGTTQYYAGFGLSAAGGYVALVQPDGQTIASQYNYPKQLSDVSYGMITTASSTSLVGAGSSVKYLVPTASTYSSSWASPAYSDASWSTGVTGLGYGPTYTPPTITAGSSTGWGQFGTGSTWNYYVPMSANVTWEVAEAYAATQTFGGKTGHLAVIRSAAESAYLWGLVGNTSYWTGLTNSSASPFNGTDYGSEVNNPVPNAGTAPTATNLPITGITHNAAVATATMSTKCSTLGLAVGDCVCISGATPAAYDGVGITTSGPYFEITAFPTAYSFSYTMQSTPTSIASGTITGIMPQKGYGFVWCDGALVDPFTYQAWPTNQPNNSSGGATPANYVQAQSSSGSWDDRADANNNTLCPYVIEFNTQLAAPPGGTSGTDYGNFSVTEVHSSSSLSSLSAGMNLLSNPGSNTVTKSTGGAIEYDDPDNVAAGHYNGFAFVGNTSGADHNFVDYVKGTIQIPTTGTYTFDVNSSDWFSLTIDPTTPSATAPAFLTAAGTHYGTGTTVSGNTLTNSGASAHTVADAGGQIALTAGTYPIDLYYVAGATNAPRLELLAASGALAAYSASFRLIGDTGSGDGGLSVVGISSPAATSQVGTNLQSAMQNVNATALVRIPFSVDDPTQCTQLTLSMEYDDGFVAYLNGTQVLSVNAPASPAWNSTATAVHGSGDATRYESFNLSSDQSLLVGGTNVLAIQGLNYSSSDSDFLVLPQLQYGSININNIEYFTTPTPGATNVPGNLGIVPNIDFGVSDGFYTAPFYTSLTDSSSAATIAYTLDGRTPVIPTIGTAETISGITASGTNNLTATVTTASAHGYYTGEQVEIAGVTPTQFDGVFNISVLSPTTFTYTMLSTPSGSALGAMTAALIPVSTVNSRTITSITYGGTGLSNTTATVTCTGHGYSNGELIQISGASPWQYNGIFTITTLNPSTGLAVDANTFYYTMSSAPSTSASGTLLAAAVSTLTYTGPIYINSTTTLRAEAYEAGYFTSHLDTASYIFMNDVINQPQIFTDDPANYFYSLNQTCVKDPSFNSNNYPTMWTGIDGGDTEPHGNSPTTEGQYQDLYSADYQMDPEVVTDPNYASTIISDMQTIPTLSLVMNPDDWFGEGSSGTNGIRGIYVNSAQTDPNGATSPQWKRECSAELINPDGSVGFQINASIKMHGGGSAQPTKEVEHSFTLGFTNDYDGPLNYPFFGPSGEQSFNELTLRAGYNDSWTHGTESQRQYGSYLQEEFANAELAALGGPDRHGNWVNLYINGIYWGLYNPTEYPDSNFSAAYQGGNTADWDTIKVSETGPPVPDDGDPYAWNTLYNIAETGSLGSPTVCPGTGTNTIAMATPAAFNLIQQYLNVPEFIDYMLVEYYGSNNDWDNHNWIAVRDSRFNGVATNAFGGFEFVNWDGERTLEGTGDNVMNVSALNGGMAGTPATEDFGPGFLFQQLKVNPEFQVMWANATHKDLYNNGPLSASGATTIYAAASQQIDRAIVGQSARWGDYHRDINYGGPGNGMWSPPAYLYTRNGLAASSYLLAGNTTTKFNNADDPNYPSNTPDTWIGNQNRMFNTYFPVRTANVITEFQNDLVYPLSSTAAPEFSSLPTGGYTASGLVSFNSIGAGAIYYTTDGTDPRVPNIASPVPVYGTPSFVKSIWLNGTTATVRVPNHGYANGETVAISGATPSNYDGNFVIGNVTQDTFTIPVTGSPAAATGTIVCQPYGISPTSTGAIVWLPSNGLAVGNKVLMSGAVQQPALNGVFVVTAVTANTFSFALTGVSLDTSDTAVTAQRVDVAVSGITYSGATATVTTATANTYSTGNLVRILGASVATFNGDFLITWLSSTQFQYTMSTTPSGSPTGTMAAVNVVSPSAHKYTFGVSITLPSPATRIRARVLNGTIWSALNDAWFTTHPAAAAGNLAITEINYDPLDPTAAELAANPAYTDNDFQFVEIQNIGTQTIDLTGVQLWIGYQLAFSFTGSAVTTLAPGAFVLVAQNSAALAQRYGSSVTPLVAGTFLQDFDHGGDRVVLTDRLGNTIEDFTFNNGGAWPGRAGGSGSTLEILNPTDDPTDPNNWHSSLDYQGSPGRSGTAAPDGVVINEILCNTQFINGVGNYGSIELY
ncbi:MAG: lamin tail domain-containing protein, partial [Thermoguttaceae bacterium]